MKENLAIITKRKEENHGQDTDIHGLLHRDSHAVHRHGVDYAKYAELLEMQYAGGTSAILVCGTTGENPTHTAEEHNKLAELTVESAAPGA